MTKGEFEIETIDQMVDDAIAKGLTVEGLESMAQHMGRDKDYAEKNPEVNKAIELVLLIAQRMRELEP